MYFIILRNYFKQLIMSLKNQIILSSTGLTILILLAFFLINFNYLNRKEEVVNVQDVFMRLDLLSGLIFALLIVISVQISMIISKRITKPLLVLTASIKDLVSSNFEKPLPINTKNSQKEIRLLTAEINTMIDQLNQIEHARQLAHSNFEESERRFKDLSNFLPQSVFEVNAQGIITYANQYWKEQLYYTDEDIVNGIIFNDTIKKNKKQKHQDGKNDHDIEVIRKDGSTFNAMIFTSKKKGDDEILGERGVIIDISERISYIKELEKEKLKAEESDKLKSSFLANMSHEIRTPMNAIIGFSGLLKDPEFPADQRDEFISIINTNCESLLKLIDDIVDIAKIESGYISIIKTDVNLNKMASELQMSVKEIKKQNRKQNIKLINLNEKDLLDEIIVTDQHRLRQILLNLFTNAVTFTNEGYICFGYSISDDKSKIIFMVQDTGIGIPKNKQEIIFERFRKASDNQENLYPGTGLGLYITKTLVKMLDGEIWLDSIPGKGTNFYFSIPYEKSKIQPSIELPKPIQNHIDISGMKILVAEDIESNYLLIKNILRNHQVQLIWVKNGIEAVDFFLNNNEADLVLMDVGMPKLNGYEATKQIKLIRSEIPIIIQTGHAMTGEKEKCMNFGADDYISKPINQADLLQKINQLVRIEAEV